MHDYYIEIETNDANHLKNVLKRIGIKSKNNLYQTCNLIEVEGCYYICHFKELFSYFDFCNYGKINTYKIYMTNDDFLKRNFVIKYVIDEGLATLKKPELKEYLDKNSEIQDLYIHNDEYANLCYRTKFEL